MDPNEYREKCDALAREILRLSRNTLLVNLRFMDMALSMLTPEALPVVKGIATDGEKLYYSAPDVLRSYKAEKEAPVRDYLHAVMHCVFRHSFVDTLLNLDCWDLACDIAVENAINELGLKAASSKRQALQSIIIAQHRAENRPLTAERLYRYYLDLDLPSEQYQQIRQAFRGDDHALWYLPPEGDGGGVANENTKLLRRSRRVTFPDGPGENGGPSIRSQEQLAQEWADISKRMQTDLETFSKQRGDTAGSLTQNLKEVNREKYDYSDFLWHFATMGEAMKINDDEFDYIFYTYGMEHYSRMPLIEPLEYKEVKRIKEFVIAIDTSGSVQGELVQKFVQKTYNILKQQESFFTKINLHIIQCDAEIQEDVKITNQAEFDEYMKTMQLHGFGGTDFRPVFSYVDELIRKKEFTNLKGMIYFTDGYGVFPEKMPNYLTAFVFVQDDYDTPEVPAWVIRLILRSDEIYEETEYEHQTGKAAD